MALVIRLTLLTVGNTLVENCGYERKENKIFQEKVSLVISQLIGLTASTKISN